MTARKYENDHPTKNPIYRRPSPYVRRRGPGERKTECGKTPGALVSLCFFSLFFLFCYSPSFTVFRENQCWLAQPTACAQEVLNEHLILFLQDRKYYLEV